MPEEDHRQQRHSQEHHQVQRFGLTPDGRNLTEERVQHIIQAEQQFLGRPLNPDELAAVHRRVLFDVQHAGHESQHSKMALILLGSLFLSQILIGYWKKRSPRTYQSATLLGLWVMPLLMAVNAGNWRFVLIHVLFSLANSWIVWKAAFESPIKSHTPKLVYGWYSRVYTVSYAVGGLGYFLLLLAFFHVPALLTGASLETEAHIFETGLIVLFYGLYFGTLGRDFVDRLADKMATSMGYYSKTGFPSKHLRSNMCAICGLATSQGQIGTEGLFVLDCRHGFHFECIKGWTIIGKKDMCPCCKEKVDLKAFQKNPWDTAQQLYLNLLDTLRYLLVWNPMVFFLVHFVFKLFGLK